MLIRTLRGLLQQNRAAEVVVIETTGPANPAPLIRAFYADLVLAAQCRLVAVVTVVDAVHWNQKLAFCRDTDNQSVLASVTLLNKAPMVGNIPHLPQRTKAQNPLAILYKTDPAQNASKMVPGSHGCVLQQIARPFKSRSDRNHHDRGDVLAVAQSVDSFFDPDTPGVWLTALLTLRGQDILTTTGVVACRTKMMFWCCRLCHCLWKGISSPCLTRRNKVVLYVLDGT